MATFDRQLVATDQVHREGWGGAIALDTLLEDDSIRNGVVIFRNDCAPALYALEKGSARSAPLQGASTHVHKRCIERGLFPRFIHVSGKRLVEEGIDEGSRRCAKSLRGPACGPALRETILGFASRNGVRLTFDFFAAQCNHIVPRFAAWTPEVGAEVVDAFSARNWNCTLCPHCGAVHRECGFYFPPPGLEHRVVTRAASDGVMGIFLVPVSNKAGYLAALRRRACAELTVEGGPGSFEFTDRVMSKHALLLVDFGSCDAVAPACGPQAFSSRGVSPRVRTTDFETCELEAVQHTLRRLGGEEAWKAHVAARASQTTL